MSPLTYTSYLLFNLIRTAEGLKEGVLFFVMTSRGNHGNHWLYSMIFLLLLLGATFISNLKFLA